MSEQQLLLRELRIRVAQDLAALIIRTRAVRPGRNRLALHLSAARNLLEKAVVQLDKAREWEETHS